MNIVFSDNIGQRGILTSGEHNLQGQIRVEGHPFSIIFRGNIYIVAIVVIVM